MQEIKKKLLKSLFIPLTFTLTLIIQSCNDKPTDIGYSFLTDTIAIYPLSSDDTKLITGIISYKFCPNMLNCGVIYLGRHQTDEGVYQAIAMIRFALGEIMYPDSLRNAVANVFKIVSAKLVMNPTRYAFGGNDTANGNLAFTAYKLNKLFLPDSCYDDPTSLMDLGYVAGRYSGGIKLKDTLDKITLDIDTALVREWMVFSADSTKDTLINGIGFVPDPGTTVINQFVSAVPGSEAGKNNSYIELIVENQTARRDTFKLFSSIDASYVSVPLPEKDEFVLSGGASIRTDMYFDLSSIPPFSGIHKAELELYINPNESRRGNFSYDMNLRAIYAKDTSLDVAIPGELYAVLDTVKLGKYTFPLISPAIEIWNRNKNIGKITINYGPTENREKYRVDRLSFYGLNAPDSTKRPKLKIIYSKRPERNCK